jgi:hypothetical protein
MNKQSRIIGASLAVLIALLFWISHADARSESGKTFYVKANIWYEVPEKIFSTNYHKGTIIPVGAKVTIKDTTGKGIVFSDENSITFRIIYMRKHNPGVSVWDHFDRYFSETDPMRSGGPFKKFTKAEQDNIRTGVIEEGMSKDAVLMSYGYPPSHRTPSLKGNMWTYWVHRFGKKMVYFQDDKVTRIGK